MRFAIVGDPVAHSRSPAMHTAAFAACGIDASYTRRRTAPDGFGEVVAELRSGELTGVNVTMPHKRNARHAVDIVDEQARRAGAVNTILTDDDRLGGYNTDVAGVRYAVDRVDSAGDHPVAVLGYGGAAAAALLALEGSATTIVGRNPSRARDLVQSLDVRAEVGVWGTSLAGCVVVNATPLGMHGETLPPWALHGAVAFVDLAYGDAVTPAVRSAENAGIPFADGIDMLVGQAVVAFELFTGQRVAPSVMERAARRAPSV